MAERLIFRKRNVRFTRVDIGQNAHSLIQRFH